MKHGFKLVLHKSIPVEDKAELVEYLAEHIMPWFTGPGSYKCRAESGAFFRRGKFGLLVGKEEKYVFRRLVRNRRIFGIMPVSMLERKDGKPLELAQCMCGIHRAGQMVNIIGGFVESDYESIFTIGDIKG